MAISIPKESACNLVNTEPLKLEYDNLFAIALVVSGDFLIVTDRNSWKVLLYRHRDSRLLATTDRLESEPRGICFINNMEICVAVGNKIEIMSVQCTGDKGVITHCRTLHQNTTFDYFSRVVKCMDKVVVCGRHKEYKICWFTVPLNGPHFDTVHQVSNGLWSYMTAKHNMIYISCRAKRDSPDNGVYGYDIENPSKQAFICKHKYLNWPSGITVDTMGFIFVGNYFPSCVNLLTNKCDFVKTFRDGMPRNRLTDLFWDEGLLYVTREWKNVIIRYKTEYSLQQAPDSLEPVIVGSSTPAPTDVPTPAQTFDTTTDVANGSVSSAAADPTVSTRPSTLQVSTYGPKPSPTADVMQAPALGSTPSKTTGSMQGPTSASTSSITATSTLSRTYSSKPSDIMQTAVSSPITLVMEALTFASTTSDIMQAPGYASTIYDVTSAPTTVSTPSTTSGLMHAPTSGSIQSTTAGSTPFRSTTVDVMQTPPSVSTSSITASLMPAPSSSSTTADVMQVPPFVSLPSTTSGHIPAPPYSFTTADIMQPPTVDDTGRFMHMACLLVNVGSRVLRRLLHHHTVTVTCTLDQYLANNRVIDLLPHVNHAGSINLSASVN